jgi:hypothetical protein
MPDKGKGKAKRHRLREDTPQSGGNGSSHRGFKRVQASGAHQYASLHRYYEVNLHQY